MILVSLFILKWNGIAAEEDCNTILEKSISINANTPNQIAIQIYPNPTSGDFMVRFSANPDGYMLTLRAMNGNPITTQSVMPNTLESSFVTDNIPNGIYFLEVKRPFCQPVHHKIIIIH